MTALRNVFWFAVVVCIVATVMWWKTNHPNPDDPGVKVTLSVIATNFDKGDVKPAAHYRTTGIPQMTTADDGIPVNEEGFYRQSLGVLKRGTHVIVWGSVDARHSGKHHIKVQLWFNGKPVCTKTSPPENFAICDEVVR